MNVFDQKSAAKSKKWTREMGVDLAASMAPFIRPLGYQVMLGGSVLTKGVSQKNINLYFMPSAEPTQVTPKDMELITWLASILGKATKTYTATVTNTTYKHYFDFSYDGLTVQVRIGR